MFTSGLLLSLVLTSGIEIGVNKDGPQAHQEIPRPLPKPPVKHVTPERVQATESALASVMERLTLPPMPGLDVTVDALHASLFVKGADVNALFAAIKGHTTLCPRIEKRADGVKLGCETQQIEARVSHATLDIRRLRGIPMADPLALPLFPFEPPDFGWGAACPGNTPMGRGECLLRDPRQRPQAKAALTEALKSVERNAAAMRLGELAMEGGNAAEALQFFETAGKSGTEGKLARMHVCEMTGNCLGKKLVDPLSDVRDIPEPMRTELELRWMRLNLYTGSRDPVFLSLLDQQTRPAACLIGLPFCEEMVQEALATMTDHATSLTLFMKLQSQSEVPLAVPVVEAAAEVASLLGAPLFGANLLAAASPRVPPALLGQHLLRTTELYVAGGDLTRADVILTFARQKLGGTALAQRPWVTVQRALKTKPQRMEMASRRAGVSKVTSLRPPSPDGTEDLARATTVLSQARRFGGPEDAP